MRKIIILSVLAVFLAGCGANPTGYTEDSSTEGTTMATTKPIETTTDIIDNKVSEALDKIEEAKNTALSEIKSAKTITTTMATTAILESKKTLLDVVSESEQGRLLINSVHLDYEKGETTLNFIVQSNSDFTIRASSITFEIDGQVKKVYNGSLPKPVKVDEVYESKKCFTGFLGVPTSPTVTLTYAFEGYDPVTVTFDIPV